MTSPVGNTETRKRTGEESRAIGEEMGTSTGRLVGAQIATRFLNGKLETVNKIKQIPTLSLAFQLLKIYSIKTPVTTGNIPNAHQQRDGLIVMPHNHTMKQYNL